MSYRDLPNYEKQELAARYNYKYLMNICKTSKENR